MLIGYRKPLYVLIYEEKREKIRMLHAHIQKPGSCNEQEKQDARNWSGLLNQVELLCHENIYGDCSCRQDNPYGPLVNVASAMDIQKR